MVLCTLDRSQTSDPSAFTSWGLDYSYVPYSIHVVLEQELGASWKARQALSQLSTSLAQFYLLLPVLGGVHIYARYSSVFISFVVSRGQGKVCLKLGIICEVVSQGKPHSIYKKWRFNEDNLVAKG